MIALALQFIQLLACFDNLREITKLQSVITPHYQDHHLIIYIQTMAFKSSFALLSLQTIYMLNIYISHPFY